MTEAEILARTYLDTCTVYRSGLVTKANGESVFVKGEGGILVYENIPCALSRHSGGQLNQSPSTATAPVSYSLFVRPEIDIQAGDRLVILQLGKVTKAVAGRAQCHPSHNNIPLKLEKEVV